jgi:hypothetical protein
MSDIENFGMLMAEDSESEANSLLMYRINSLVKERDELKDNCKAFHKWRDKFPCCCNGVYLQGNCLRCDIEKLIGKGSSTDER